MNSWNFRPVPFKYKLGDLNIFSVSLKLQFRAASVFDSKSLNIDNFSKEPAEPNSQGFLIRGIPIDSNLDPIVRHGRYLCYAPLQYKHCYIDLSISHDEYQKKFSSKTRSTLTRKLKKFAEHCGNETRWATYRQPEEMRDFLAAARQVSKLTYQERLLDAGIPNSHEFTLEAERLAGQDSVRAYILFDRDRPVAYLYCPVKEGILIYAYLGYDPSYLKLSVGTILQSLAIEQLFNERRFRYFDFTEGQSDHKRLFATHQRLCANVYWIKATVFNTLVVYTHHWMNGFSNWLGRLLEERGLKSKIKRLLRS
jgi:CelD/BcsL family acetyltransferase involved in cellulose biosynthesis